MSRMIHPLGVLDHVWDVEIEHVKTYRQRMRRGDNAEWQEYSAVLAAIAVQAKAYAEAIDKYLEDV